MTTTDAQVRKLMKELNTHGKIGRAALRSGMDRKTARKYRDAGQLPGELNQPRTWRTRPDPFEQDATWIAAVLSDAPELEAKALFEHLLAQRPGVYQESHLRTFQRWIKRWRALHGPPKEVFFPQAHRPGEALQTDFTNANKLGITIGGEPFDHLLCHPVLPYSNWESITVCRSESLLALQLGIQTALWELGRVPAFSQTDHSTAATHDLKTSQRGFNEDYLALMRHYGMQPRTIGIGKCEQNGDVEAANGVLKRRLKQHLLLRGSRDFDRVEAYQQWVREVARQANRPRTKKLREEMAAMCPLPAKRLPAHKEETARVTGGSTISVMHNLYSVPARLIGERVQVRLFEDHLEVFYAGVCQLNCERLLGKNQHRIDYRHIIESMVRKPGAFARYRYREELFPQLTFRRAYDECCERLGQRAGEIEYVRLLHLAARTMESEVALALDLLREEGQIPTAKTVKGLVEGEVPVDVPQLRMLQPDLSTYDALLGAGSQPPPPGERHRAEDESLRAAPALVQEEVA